MLTLGLSEGQRNLTRNGKPFLATFASLRIQ